MKFSTAASKWLTALRGAHYSLHTCSNYERDLRQLREWATGAFGHAPECEELSRDLIVEHLASLRERGMSAVTIERHRWVLISFFKYASTMFGIGDPMARTGRLRSVPRRLPEYLTEAEIKALIEVQPPYPHDPSGARALRDRALIEILYSSGLRTAEVSGLDWRDIAHPDAGYVMVRFGKGNKDRVVPVGEPAQDSLNAWRAVAWAQDEEGPVFQNCRGERLTARRIQFIVHDRAELAGIRRRVFPHMIRHCFATHLLQAGADLASIATMLGHSNFETTTRYAHVNVDYLKRQHRFHPREQLLKEGI